MKNMQKETGATVTVHNGACSMGGMFITETFYTATIEKINRKSIRLHLTHIKVVRTGSASKTQEVLADRDMNTSENFPYWKTVETRVGDWTSRETVSRELYRNGAYGILEF